MRVVIKNMTYITLKGGLVGVRHRVGWCYLVVTSSCSLPHLLVVLIFKVPVELVEVLTVRVSSSGHP